MGSSELVLRLWCSCAAPSRGSAGDDEGGTLVEYALIVGLIAVVALAAIQLLGSSVSTAISDAASSI
jgi:Flp pilus assembly pilin Flp